MGLLWKFALFMVPIAILISACGIYKVIREFHDALNKEEIDKEQVNPNTWHLFTKFDKDFDGFLDVNEFQSAIDYTVKQISQQGLENEVLNTELIKQSLMNRSISDDEEYLTLNAKFKPLDLTTMSKYKNENGIDILGTTLLKGLRQWQHPFVSHVDFASREFEIFLPKFTAVVGDVWEVVQVTSTKYERNLPHNRMHPAVPNNAKEKFLMQLLSMFHPRPFVQTRFAPQGTTAVLRAVNEKYYDIVFRIHAEFQINEPPNFAFWYTPAQFTGRLIVDKKCQHVEHFEMFVPNDKKLNVDMEWITGRKKNIEHIDDAWDMEVDIGFMSEMSLKSDGPTRKAGHELPNRQQMIWDEEISEWEARRLLQQKFYPFQKVLYRPFNETYEVAEKEDKLVHQILLWGALDDQSC